MEISLDDFKKIELKVGTVLEVERVEGSEKLLKLKVDLGSEQRQILSGIAKFYPPESLVNKQIIVIANLQPRTMMGLESQGMVLAADTPDGPVILIPEKEVLAGAGIK